MVLISELKCCAIINFVFEFSLFDVIYALYKTLLVRCFLWALVFYYAIASSYNNRVDYIVVMRIDYIFHVGHATVAYFKTLSLLNSL